MTDHPFGDAQWISRAVPASQRISRETRRDRIDWAPPGGEITQSFTVDGQIRSVGADIAGPLSDAPFEEDVRFTLTVESDDGRTVAQRLVEGPQIVWDWFGQFVDVTPAAPPGTYRLVLRPERGTIGWHTSDQASTQPDDGVSPLPVVGEATIDGSPVPGTRLIAVDTEPAPNPVFRTSFTVGPELRSARLHASVLGCGFVRLNGRRVSEEDVDLPVTDYDKTVLYRSYDVSHLLRPGANEVVVEAGRDRYSARGGDVWGWNVAGWHREPSTVVRLALEYADATTADVVSGPGWEAAPGPVVEKFFQGEAWTVGAEPSAWSPALVVAAPRGRLRAAQHAPVRRLASVPAVTVRSIDAHTRVFDMGQVMTGRIHCVVTGGPAAFVEVVSGEQLHEDGTVLCENRLAAGAAQVDTLRLDRVVKDLEWEPQFGYRGFRWVQVRTEGDVQVEQVRAVPVYTPLDVTGDFACSNPVVEWIDGALARTFRNNLHGIPTDTPIYEKNGWTADAHLATEALLHHADLRASFMKWMDDHVDAQSDDGAVPQIIPTPGWGRASDPAWSASAVLIPWYLYQEYGDPAILERYAPMIRRFADDIAGRLDAGLWRERSWGDWLAPGYRVGPEGMAPIGTLMAVTVLQHTAAVLAAIEQPAGTYVGAAAACAKAYHDTYFEPAQGAYGIRGLSYRQSLNILPLAFGIVPEEHIGSVRSSLVDDLEHRTGGHLDCGAVGVRHLLDVLSAAGRYDLALTVLTTPTRP
ncbi:MAG TPA: family 78 glycoside hydrolase catalytic domain, partial [Propionibacteriaceae bacterium]|nr:family 78 glycoside hydrolase catalytic domain [Propionibacteriaceae bacterium]